MSLGLSRLLFILLPRLRNPSFGGEDRLLGMRNASEFPLPRGAALSVALEYISAAVLLIPLEGDLNASVGIVIATVRYSLAS